MENINNLFLDIQKGNNRKVKETVNKLGVDARDNFERTPLMNAVFYGNYELAKWLIENNANVNLQDKNGYSALHFSSQENKLDCTRLLLQNKANPNLMDIHGNTPSVAAVMNWKAGENFETLKTLVEHKADLNIKNKANRSAYSLLPDKIKEKLNIK